MRPVDPAIAGPELELRQLRLVLDQIQRGEHHLGVHAGADRVGHCGHRSTSSVVVLLMGLSSRVACTRRAPPPRFGSEMWRDRAIGLSASSETLWGPCSWRVALRPLTGEAVARVGLDICISRLTGAMRSEGVAVQRPRRLIGPRCITPWP